VALSIWCYALNRKGKSEWLLVQNLLIGMMWWFILNIYCYSIDKLRYCNMVDEIWLIHDALLPGYTTGTLVHVGRNNSVLSVFYLHCNAQVYMNSYAWHTNYVANFNTYSGRLTGHQFFTILKCLFHSLLHLLELAPSMIKLFVCVLLELYHFILNYTLKNR